MEVSFPEIREARKGMSSFWQKDRTFQFGPGNSGILCQPSNEVEGAGRHRSLELRRQAWLETPV